MFTQLLGVTGVGPKSALGVLSALTVAQIAEAVAPTTTRRSAASRESAPRRPSSSSCSSPGKIAAPRRAGGAARDAAPGVAAQVAQALIGLGWSRARRGRGARVGRRGATPADRAAVPALLRLTLATLGPARKEHAGG